VRLPQPAAAQIERWSSPIVTVPSVLANRLQGAERINAPTDEAQSKPPPKHSRARRNKLAYEPHAANSAGAVLAAQLQEQLTWFG